MMRISKKAEQFTESAIRNVMSHAVQHNALDLLQGLPDLAEPHKLVKLAAHEITAGDMNKYVITRLRETSVVSLI